MTASVVHERRLTIELDAQRGVIETFRVDGNGKTIILTLRPKMAS